jgi:hypothetical protein
MTKNPGSNGSRHSLNLNLLTGKKKKKKKGKKRGQINHKTY